MTLRLTGRSALPLLFAVACSAAQAQQLIGYVNTRDADITGASDVLDGQAVLTGSVGVTAKDHTAPITLGRGGTVRVCQTSVLHVTESRAVSTKAPLLFSLDRGAIEIQTNGTPTDAIMTPDMRFTIRNAGPLDLRLRVARNGDTCVENRGPVAPTLAVSDPFGEAMYEVGPGQHILFEHGSLHEVVDHETSPCGCPEYKGVSVADALLASGGSKPTAPATPPVTVQPAPAPPPVAVQAAPPPPPVVVQNPQPAAVQAPPPTVAQTPPQPAAVAAPVVVQPPPPAVATKPVATPPPSPVHPTATQSQPNDLATLQATEQAAEQTAAQSAIRAADRSAKQTAAQAAERHPFPSAISEGLAPPAEAPPVPPGQPRAQITESLSYNAPSPAPTPAAPSSAKKAPAVQPPPPPAAKPAPPAKAAPPAHPPAHDLVSFFGNFFRKLFGRS
jgi:hypothetical protein